MFGHLYIRRMNPKKDKITPYPTNSPHPRRFHVSRCVRLALAFALISTLVAAQTPVRDRITQAIDDQDVKLVKGNVHGLARAEFDQGRMDPSTRLEGVTLAFRPSAAQQKDLDKLLVDLQDPKSPVYHQWLTPDQFGALFGMSDSDLAQVKSWLEGKGFTVDDIAPSRNRIHFSGTVAQLESAFRMEMHRYNVKGEDHFANATDPSMPAAFTNLVVALGNLHDFRPKPRARQIRAHFSSGQTGNNFLAPNDFAKIYHLDSLYSLGLDGTGVTIAIAGQTALGTSAANSFVDVDAFRTNAGLPAHHPTLTLVPSSGVSTVFSNDLQEAALDVEWSGAVAKNADVNFVYVGNSTNFSVFDSITYAVSQHIGSVISTSYGFCETAQTPGFITQFDAVIGQANSQGQTITAATGDTGAADCEDPTTSKSATTGLSVDHPASSPGVTAMGGTEFNEGSNTSTYWLATTPPNGPDIRDSALQYIPEIAWNDTTFELAHMGFLSATGGGKSVKYAKPAFQSGAIVTPADSARDVPDIAFSSSGDHDGYLMCHAGSCVNGFRDANNVNLDVVGGTSVAAPTFAAVIAILNQGTGSTGLGNINPTLYNLASTTPAAFHDITTGDNKVPCTAPSTNCPAGTTQIGYSAGVGYDQVTGLGSPDALALTNAWPGLNVTPTFSFGATPSGASVTARGQSATSTINLTAVHGFNGTVNLSCTPPTSVEITCGLSSASASLNGNSTTATLTINTTAAHAIGKTLARLEQRRGTGWMTASGFLLAGVLLVGVPKRRWFLTMMLTFTLLLFALTIFGCGGGSSTPPDPGTPSGTHTVTVTAASGSTTRTTTVTVTVP